MAPVRERRRPSDEERQIWFAPAGEPHTKTTAPKLSRAPADATLAGPTLKAALALGAVVLVAAGAGALIGLPVPGLGGSDSSRDDAGVAAPSAASASFLDAGTPVGLTEGPYRPVVGTFGYGEALARFGAPRGGRRHEGQDVFAKPGTPLVAVREGVVTDWGTENGQYSGGRGNYLTIYSQLDDRSYVYLHLLKPAIVGKGETVEAGQPVGQLGCTGSCDGPHLHFEVRLGRQGFANETKAIDPLPLLKSWQPVPAP